MARWMEPTAEQLTAWHDWSRERPHKVRQLTEQFDPWTLYLLKSSGHRVTIHGYSEDGTMIVNVTGQFNLVGFERHVFGIEASDLEECDLPPEGEPLGVILNEQETLSLINEQRAENGLEPVTQEQLDEMKKDRQCPIH